MINKEICEKRDKTPAFWILAGIPVVCVIGSMMHFVYEWSGELSIVGLIAPVNESVWEHMKLIFWPSLLWWAIGYLYIKKRHQIAASQWFYSAAAGLYVGPLFIAAFYYTYTGAFGIHSLLVDILSFFLGVAAAQLIALHVYRYAETSKLSLIFAVIAMILFGAVFIICTLAPPSIPLFIDPSL